MLMTFDLSALEERALAFANADPAGLFAALVRDALAPVVAAYQAAGASDVASLKSALDRADPATRARVQAVLARGAG